MIDADWARCDIIDRDWSPPPRPADCEFDYGQGISLAPGEPAQFVCAGDTAFGADEVLPYGDSITAGALRCESADVGHHMPRYPDQSWLLDFTAGVSAVLTSPGARTRAPVVEICAATLEWTIVVLRDGRRCRSWRADVAQLVAHHLAKVRVAGSNPVIRSKVQWHQPQRWSGRVVRQRPAKPCTRVRFPSPPPRGTPRD